MTRLQPAWRGARTPQTQDVRLLPREIVRWRARVKLRRTSAACWRPRLARQIAAVHRERGRASLAQWASMWTIRLEPARRGAHAASARGAPPPERERARWRVCVCAHANACCWLEAAAGTSQHGRAPRERAVSLAQWDSIGQGTTPTSAARRAHAASARGAPPPERESARGCAYSCVHAQESLWLKAAASMSERCRAPREGTVSLAQWTSMGHEPTPTSAAQRVHAASARGARPPERECARWRVCVCAHANAGCSTEAAAGTSQHGRAPRQRAVSLAQWASIGHEPTPTSAEKRARRKRAWRSSSRERACSGALA